MRRALKIVQIGLARTVRFLFPKVEPGALTPFEIRNAEMMARIRIDQRRSEAYAFDYALMNRIVKGEKRKKILA
jgi:hypothetical protein